MTPSPADRSRLAGHDELRDPDAPRLSRRALLAALIAAAFSRNLRAESADAPVADLPTEVAGIRLPRSPLAAKAARFAQQSCPPFLFNHCMRTYLFGALAMEHHHSPYNAENAFVAASLHDLGLLTAFATSQSAFEFDSADRAAQFARDNGALLSNVEDVWQAIALHASRFALAQHRAGAAMLVSMGAGSDVLGPDADMVDSKRAAEIVAAFPRLAFKKEFTALLVDHCRRKPLSQRGTWLEGLCRETTPGVWTSKLQESIAAAPFGE
jgi:hypothetical protein